MSRDCAVGRIRKPPLPKRRLRAGNHARPATGKRDAKRLIRRTCTRQRALLEFATGGDEIFPLRARKLAASPGKPRFDEVCDGKVDIIAAQEDMLAHSHAPD